MNADCNENSKSYFEIFKWNFKLLHGRLVVEGIQKGSNRKWHSGRIVRMLSPNLLQSKSSSVYCLMGPPDPTLMTSFDLTEEVFERFMNGLPPDWRLYLFHSSERPPTVDGDFSTYSPHVDQLSPPTSSTPPKCSTDQLSPPTSSTPPRTSSMDQLSPPTSSTSRISSKDQLSPPTSSTPHISSKDQLSPPTSSTSRIRSEECPSPPTNTSSTSRIRLMEQSLSATPTTDNPFFSSLKRSSRGRLIKPILHNITDSCCSYSYSINGDLMGMSRPVTIKGTPTTKKKGSTQNTPKDTIHQHDPDDSGTSNDKNLSSIDNDNISTNQRRTREDSSDNEQRVSPPGDNLVEEDDSMGQQSTSAPVTASRKRRKHRRISFPSKRKKKSVKGKAQELVSNEKQPVPTTVKGKGREPVEVERRGPVKEDLTSDDESERRLNNRDSHYQSDCEDSSTNDIQSSILSKVWNEENTEELKRIVLSTPAISDSFWEDVSTRMGGAYTAEDCLNQYNEINCHRGTSTRQKNLQDNEVGVVMSKHSKQRKHVQDNSFMSDVDGDRSDDNCVQLVTETNEDIEVEVSYNDTDDDTHLNGRRKPLKDSIMNRYEHLKALTESNKQSTNPDTNSLSIAHPNGGRNYSKRYTCESTSSNQKTKQRLVQLAFSSDEEESEEDDDGMFIVNETYNKMMTEPSY